jgi:hypothetical protein
MKRGMACQSVFRPLAIAAIALAAALPSHLDAFGEAGHRVVGHLAELHLRESRALKEVRAILRPQETLADAAYWPDAIKSSAYEDAESGAFRLEHPAHESYHYTNLAFQSDRYGANAPGAHYTDIVRMSRESIRVLKGASLVFTKREALRLLAHFVGDIHQPLHVGNAFVTAKPPLRFTRPEGSSGWISSLGGNALRYGPQDTFNLHSLWDSHAVNLAMQRLDPPAYALRLVKELQVSSGWRNSGDVALWPETWATEALEYAEAAHKGIAITAYLGPDEDGRTAHRWRVQPPPGYEEAARTRVRTQLAKAGYRLAATLKAIWPDKP